MKALEYLPLSCTMERNSSLELLLKIAPAFKEIGRIYFGKGEYSKALKVYEQALCAYQHPLFANQNKAEELTVYSNIIITLRKLVKNSDVMIIAKHTIEHYLDVDNQPIKQKVMFNLLGALKDGFQIFQNHETKLAAWSQFFASHSNLLNIEMNAEWMKFLLSQQENAPKSNGSYTRDISFFTPAAKPLTRNNFLAPDSQDQFDLIHS